MTDNGASTFDEHLGENATLAAVDSIAQDILEKLHLDFNVSGNKDHSKYDEISVVKENQELIPDGDDDQVPCIICDLGYGLPKEARPRKEKVLAIARQMVNFLEWQQTTVLQQQQQQQLEQEPRSRGRTQQQSSAHIQIVTRSSPQNSEDAESIQKSLLQRMQEIWKKSEVTKEMTFPHDTISFVDETLEELFESYQQQSTLANHGDDFVYLSPDADTALDVNKSPPKIVVVGLLIDRRIQVNRSLQRASKASIPAARWPMEVLSDVLHPNEPLNVDCILEGMQQWYWSGDFFEAGVQALQHHCARHPERPVHKISHLK